ncbi:MAG: hypothetical protein SFX18_16440 [Pirellulales bacterium]|nr:hypothetical protein [Pirellulales bacterium]
MQPIPPLGQPSPPTQPPQSLPPPLPPDRSAGAGVKIIETLLNPHSLQILMACGGGMLTLGFVLWLWSQGLFDNPWVAAVCLGVGNLAILAGGVSLVRFTRHALAGRGITLLACLLLPLNLWFYDAQGLISLANGGQLWIPALVCCVIYALVARFLRDSLFVYALVAGVTMTGLLFLADARVDRFWEVLAPAALCVIVGGVCIHLERIFPANDGPFSRDRFGRAFLQAGHVVMYLGLMILLAGRLAARFYDPYLSELQWFAEPTILRDVAVKGWSLVLVLAACYCYVYSQLVVDRKGGYFAMAALTLLWSEFILLDLLNIPWREDAWALMLAVTGLILGYGVTVWRKFSAEQDSLPRGYMNPAQEKLLTVSGILCALPVLAGMFLYTRAILVLPVAWVYTPSWLLAGGMAAAAAGCLLNARLAVLRDDWTKAQSYQYLTGFAALLCGSVALPLLGANYNAINLTALLGIPAVMLLVGRRSVYAMEHACWRNAALCALVTLFGLACLEVVGRTVNHNSLPGAWANVGWSLFFAISAVLYSRAAVGQPRNLAAFMASLSICAATWQLLLLCGMTTFAPILALTLSGLVMLAVHRWFLEPGHEDHNEPAFTEITGNIATCLGGAGGVLLAANQLLGQGVDKALLGLLAGQVAALAVAAFLTRKSGWKSVLGLLSGLSLVMAMVVLNSLLELTTLQRVELFATLTGVALVSASYAGWWQERDKPDSATSFGFVFGSLLATIPLVWGLLDQRFGGGQPNPGWVVVHEAGVLALGLALLGSGVLCRIKATTLAGAGTLLVYLLSLIGLIRLPEHLQNVAVYMMIGGGAFFATAVLLSIYRDRLATLPERIRAGEGIYRVFKWR